MRPLVSTQQQFPSFHRYLGTNWLPHENLFAGFARHGVLHFDNDTNNSLERYHHTIKSVLGSVGVLMDRTISVCTFSMHQHEFDAKMKTTHTANSTLAEYRVAQIKIPQQ